MSECVKVVVRCRPMNEREKALKSKCIVSMEGGQCGCAIQNPQDLSAPPKSFSFDGVYFTDSTTEALYNDITYPLVEGALEGYNATIFCYGQTGCGKSFTMQGVPDSVQQKGIIPRAFEHIFEGIESSEDVKFLVHASYLEIYNEEIRDLLGNDIKKRLDLKEHPDNGVYVSDLSQHAVHNVAECEALVERGWKNRSTGATLMNADSSRSHSIFTINIEMMTGDEHIRKGKLNLVDLAGSERQGKTGATGDRLKEATKINLSLSALGNVISALVDGKSKHIPYRDSKLTRLLQDSLGGNTKTLMVACISPSDNNYDETLSTLRYANRAKNIKNKPIINQDPKDALLLEYQAEIQQLRNLLENHTAQKLNHGSVTRRHSILDLEEEKAKIRAEYEAELKKLRENYVAEQESNQKLQADVQTLKLQYEKDLETMDTTEPDMRGLLNGMAGSGGEPMDQNGSNTLSPLQQETLARLHEIEENMVGGERAHDKELKEKRQKKKRAAEKRSRVAAESSRSDDEENQILMRAYDNIQEEMRIKTEALKKSKQKIRALNCEVRDVYSEFQNDRTDYLETIRKQDQQLKLLHAILDKIQPTIRRDCNYSNLDKVRSECVWSEETLKWKIPDLVCSKTKLPPAGANQNRNIRASSRTAPTGRTHESEEEGDDENQRSVLTKKFETNQPEVFTENYFKPKRATELLMKAQADASRVILNKKNPNHGDGLNTNTKSPNGGILVNWNNHFNVVSKTNSHNPAQHPSLSHSWGSSPVPILGGTLNGGGNGFLSSPEMSTIRRPTRLEALPSEVTAKALRKLKQTLEVAS